MLKMSFYRSNRNSDYLHGAGEGHLLQRWFSSGPEAEIHPWQNHCHSGSTGGSGPGAQKFNSFLASWINKQQIKLLEDGNEIHRVPTDRLVFDGGAGHAEVKLAVLLDAGIDQSLHWALILKQQEGIAYTETEQSYSCLVETLSIDKESCWNSGHWSRWLCVRTRLSTSTAGGHKLLQTRTEADK